MGFSQNLQLVSLLTLFEDDKPSVRVVRCDLGKGLY